MLSVPDNLVGLHLPCDLNDDQSDFCVVLHESEEKTNADLPQHNRGAVIVTGPRTSGLILIVIDRSSGMLAINSRSCTRILSLVLM